MKILFVMRHGTYLRNYESTIRLLTAQGHVVDVGFNGTKQALSAELDAHIKSLSDECQGLRFHRLGPRRDYWAPLANQLRMFRNYLRYLHPRYRDAVGLVERAEMRVCRAGRLVKHLPVVRGRLGTAVLSWLLRHVERSIPSDPALEDVIRSHRPDVVLITPLVDFAPDQIDYLKAAKRLGIPTVLCVASWDNLTNKGLIPIEPDLVIVWNADQLREAVELHGIPAEKVAVTGAQLFDHWFERQPSTTREEFCARLGFDPARHLLLYLCSTQHIAPDEVEFVDRWLRRLRACPEPQMRDANLLVRPHPASAGHWQTVEYAEHGKVVIWPRKGGFPVGPSGQADFFDSLHHSAAVVGINTTALIEAGVVGRRCFTILAPETAHGQKGTLHFQYLKDSGFLAVSDSLETHFTQLHAELEGRTDSQERIGEFLRSFVRPHGLDVPATPLVVDAIEKLAHASAPRPEEVPFWLRPLSSGLAPVARLTFWWRESARKSAAQKQKAGREKKAGKKGRSTPSPKQGVKVA